VTVVECTSTALERGLECARQARQAVATACRDLARDVVEIAQLLTSELVTNALQHGSGHIAVEITRSANRLRVSVDDDGPRPPRRMAAGPDAVHGRGLILVESLATKWGVIPRGTGKRVWFELRTA
jgi:anti-sigma regulatory factor (Ser/Thr protein kinase)